MCSDWSVQTESHLTLIRFLFTSGGTLNRTLPHPPTITRKRPDSKTIPKCLVLKTRDEKVIRTRSVTIILKTGAHAHSHTRASCWGRSLSQPPGVPRFILGRRSAATDPHSPLWESTVAAKQKQTKIGP